VSTSPGPFGANRRLHRQTLGHKSGRTRTRLGQSSSTRLHRIHRNRPIPMTRHPLQQPRHRARCTNTLHRRAPRAITEPP